MYLENEMNLAEMQRLQQKIGTLDENIKLMAEQVKAKSEGEHTIKLLLKKLYSIVFSYFIETNQSWIPVLYACCNLSPAFRILH